MLRARGLCAGLAAAGLFVTADTDRITAASEQSRTIAFKHIHTNETLSIVYKKDGKYVPEALEKINWIMRDWRKNQVQKMDPQTIDLLWEMHTELGSHEPINIICGYRSHETNEMLRRTVGGQASQSQHITGKAIDATFPDVPLKRMRYSALVRERGGVGYYPTSGIPFVHVDTANVRHWPRLPRYELALLFPSGHTKYQSAEGGSISKDDVRAAQAKHPELATQIADFLDYRTKPHMPMLVADASGNIRSTVGGSTQVASATPEPAPAPEQPKSKPFAVASAIVPPAPAPKPSPMLVSAPRMVERSSKLTPGPVANGPSNADRKKLDALMTLASFDPASEPKLVSAPKPALRPAAPSVAAEQPPPAPPPVAPRAEAAPGPRVAAIDPAASGNPSSLTDAGATSWIPAPAYDEEHPEELSYRPFPVAPLLTASASPDDPVLVRMTHPDVARTVDYIDDGGQVPPMRFRPGAQVAQLMWAQQFKGETVGFHGLDDDGGAGKQPSPGLADRKVRTAAH